jgi:cytosine/adenosine deaminase-related metal-dependent hydrolase
VASPPSGGTNAKQLMEHCEIIVSGGWFVDPCDGVREGLALAVQGNRITALGPAAEIASRYHSERHLDATDRIVLPGMINAHTHASATLFRGYAPDVSGKAFFDRLWRIEALLDDEDVYVGALAGCLEMIRNGVTGSSPIISRTWIRWHAQSRRPASGPGCRVPCWTAVTKALPNTR